MDEDGARSSASAPANAANNTNRLIGRNANGTMVVTSTPSNEAELQLYRVMQRASLLAYYDTLLEMGGDDVQQLCDAGEAEFLEIMALVGMASKPLHVRRLQKALQEWVNNPSLFQIPIVPSLCPTENPFMAACNRQLLNMPTSISRAIASPESNRPAFSPSPGAPENSCGSNASTSNVSPVHNQTTFSKIVLPPSPAPAAPVSVSASRSFSPQSACPPSAGSSPGSVASPVMTPVLMDVHVQKLAAAAEKLSKNLPQLEPKPQNTKKKMCKELELVMLMPDSDPRRMEEIRKYAAIYGRFDCKRKPEKPLTLHEVMVNEAAAQMSRCVPALLTRRDELFPLARQLVRKAGLHYSKHGMPPALTGESQERDEGVSPSQRPRQVTPNYHDEDGENGINVSPEMARTNSTHTWWVKTESDDADSRCSYSSASSPPPQASPNNMDRSTETQMGPLSMVDRKRLLKGNASTLLRNYFATSLSLSRLDQACFSGNNTLTPTDTAFLAAKIYIDGPELGVSANSNSSRPLQSKSGNRKPLLNKPSRICLEAESTPSKINIQTPPPKDQPRKIAHLTCCPSQQITIGSFRN